MQVISNEKVESKIANNIFGQSVIMIISYDISIHFFSYFSEVDTIISEMGEKGRRPAAFIAESLQSCGGQIIFPGRKFMSCDHCQELCQQASRLLIGCAQE